MNSNSKLNLNLIKQEAHDKRNNSLFNLKEGDENSKGINKPWIAWLKRRRALAIHVDDNEPIRLNILVPTFLNELTGGPLSILRFALEAAKARIKIRWINLQGQGMNYKQMTDRLKKYEGFENFEQLIESHVWHATSLTDANPIRTNSRDLFMGTVFDSAFIASATQKLLKNPNIIYFIQDIEGIFFPHGSLSVEAIETYDLPHFAIFSTSYLRDYFKEKKLGVYKQSQSLGDERSFSSMPAIKPFEFDEYAVKSKKAKTKRRLIVYAREGTPRNAFELSISAISEAVRLNILNPLKWEFLGVGGHDSMPLCYLDDKKDVCIKMIQNVPEPEYKRILAGSDIGLALMISPHPSLAPLDFLAAGMIVVTNSFETKTQNSFGNLSRNLIVSQLSLNGIVRGISKAILMLDNMEQTIQKSKLDWPTNWSDDRCYGKPLFSKIKKWFKHDSIFPFLEY